MTDNLTKEQRKKNMQSIKSVSNLENSVTKELWRRGFRFRKNVKNLLGKPDIAIKKYRIVIFIDSCFWHMCPLHGNTPKTNVDYWKKKLHNNQERDKRVNSYYLENNWNILRLWEHDFKFNFCATIERIIEFINNAKIKK